MDIKFWERSTCPDGPSSCLTSDNRETNAEARTIEHSSRLYLQEGYENQLYPLCNDVAWGDNWKFPDVAGGAGRGGEWGGVADHL